VARLGLRLNPRNRKELPVSCTSVRNTVGLLALFVGRNRGSVDQTILETPAFGPGSLVEGHIPAATTRLRVARQYLGLAGSLQADPYTEKLGIAVGTVVGTVAGTAESAVDKGCKHFGSHIRTMNQY